MTLNLLTIVLVYICVFKCVTCLEEYAFEGETVSLNIVFLFKYIFGFPLESDIADSMIILISLFKVHTCFYILVKRDVHIKVDLPC